MCIIKKTVVSSCLIILMCFALVACAHEDVLSADVTNSTNESIESLPQGEMGVGQAIPEDTLSSVIKTEIIDFIVPVSVSDFLNHVEVVQDGTIMEVFYAVHEDVQMEAFRILFSSKESDKDIGVIKLRDEYLYVTVSVNDYLEDDFEDEAIREKFYAVVATLSNMLDSIQTDERFFEKNTIEIDNVSRSFEYWNATLPEQLQWEETFEDGYVTTFYFTVGEKKIQLYAVSIGDHVLKSQIGFYYLNNAWQTDSVESYEIPSTEGWSDVQTTELYTMMSTINDVIQVIMSSENFSEEVPE